jgi:flagellar basal-body rod protein FlgG
MSQSLWIAKTGLDAQQTKMATISNNLANVSTNGFKRGRAIFEDLLYQNVRQPERSPRRTPCCPRAFRSVRVLAW